MDRYLFLAFIFSIVCQSYGSGSASSSDSSKGVQDEYSDGDSTKFLKVEKPLTLACNITVDDDKKPEFRWRKNNTIIKEDDERYKITNRTLTIVSAVIEDIGKYLCETTNISPPKQFEINVIALSFKRMIPSITLLEGEKLKLECDAHGTPTPTISWFKDEIEIAKAFNKSHYNLIQNEKGTPSGALEIESVVMEDRGEYMCLIQSQGATFNTTTFLRVKYMYAALWPFLGICAEVIILCLIIFIYEKRRIKNDFEESDTDQPSDNKNTDHNKDLRQRK